MAKSRVLWMVAVICTVGGLSAQTPPSPAFEVASVKPNKSGFCTPGVFRFQPDGSLRVVNMPLRDVIRVAYGLQGYQMDGWPGWLSASFDFDVHYTPDPMPLRDALPPDAAPIDPNGPSIFTALREQLGLKLNARTQLIETLIIDHVEKPTPD